MIKHGLRKAILKKRISLSKPEYWQLNEQIIEQLQLFNFADFNYVHIFLPIVENKEVDTFEFLSFFKINYPDLQIVVPRTHFVDSSMSHVLFDHEHTVLVKNKYQIPEPIYGRIVPINLIDVVFVPLLGFDLEGHRVGYGRGFYDRFLRNCRADVLKIGLSLFAPEEEILDINEFDVKLTHCITPETTYTF